MNAMFLQSAHCLAFQGGGVSIFVYASVLIGAYFAVDAACAIIAGVKLLSTTRGGWLLVAEGILRAIILIICLALSAIGLLVLMLTVVGILEIVAAIRLRKYVNGIPFFACGGIASVLFLPFVIGAFSLRLELDFSQVFGGYMIIFGALMLAFGLRMKARGRSTLHH